MPIVDVPTHMFTRRWLELLRAHGTPYNVRVRPDGRDEVFRGDTPVVFPQPGHFDYDLRLRAMNDAGIDVSIVSLTCPNVFWGGEDVAKRRPASRTPRWPRPSGPSRTGSAGWRRFRGNTRNEPSRS
jgi:aminocarboxymuconate-semialdehyde decarboxylase